MYQAANIVLFNKFLPILSKDVLECLVYDGGLFEILKATHCAFQDNQSQLEDI